MKEFNNKYIVKELQALLGVVTDDVEYLLALLLKDSNKVVEEKEKDMDISSQEIRESVGTLEELNDWFLNCEEVQH